MNHSLIYSFTHQLICSFTHTILSKISPPIFAFSACSAVRKNVNQQNKKMQNEPNLVLSEVEWISPIKDSLIYPSTHLLIHSIMSNEPNLPKVHRASSIRNRESSKKCQTNPISAKTNVTSVMTKNYNNEQRTKNRGKSCKSLFPFSKLCKRGIENEPVIECKAFAQTCFEKS